MSLNWLILICTKLNFEENVVQMVIQMCVSSHLKRLSLITFDTMFYFHHIQEEEKKSQFIDSEFYSPFLKYSIHEWNIGVFMSTESFFGWFFVNMVANRANDFTS